MTRKFPREMTEKKDSTDTQRTHDSDSSSCDEPDSPRIQYFWKTKFYRTYRPMHSPPVLVLDPLYSDPEFSDNDEIDEAPTRYLLGSNKNSLILWPIKKLISKSSVPQKENKKKGIKADTKPAPKKSFLSYFLKRK
jgi:hypothetical protein